MPDSPVISRKPPEADALNFTELRRIGIAYLEKIAGRLWNPADLHDPVAETLWRDFNTHDPGITLMELLCYGITDVTYRTTFPDADIFARKPGETAPEPAEPPFTTAAFALTSAPVTIDDYRKLFLDRFPELRNVWLDPVTETLHADTRTNRLARKPGAQTVSFEIRGLYRARLLFHDPVTQARQKEVIGELARFYHQNRNLCEDLAGVDLTPLQDIMVCAEIQLMPDADIERTHAAILHALRQFLSPVIPRYSLAELVDQGFSPDEIFQGPRLERGFILDADLDVADSPGSIRSSDLLAEILKVPGVRAVGRFQLNYPSEAGAAFSPVEWELPLTPGHHPRLGLENARLDFYKGPLPFRSDPGKVEAQLEQLQLEAAATAEVSGPFDRAIPRGTWRDLGEFTTLQESLPVNYGVGRRGFDSNASPGRTAKAKQLQAFLLIFDQLLANYLAQLTNVHQLFSEDPSLRQSYFTRAVEDLPDFRDLLATVAGDADASPEEIIAAYQSLMESSREKHDPWVERRSRILDHLLARFGETFTDQVLMHYSAEGLQSPEDILDAKLSFFRKAPSLASDRLQAEDIQNAAEVWDTANVSGFEKRLGHLLGFASSDRHSLTVVGYDLYEQRDENTTSDIRFRINDTRNGGIILSGTRRFPNKDAAAAEMRMALRLAMHRSNYRIRIAQNGAYYFVVVNIVNGEEDVVAIRRQYWATSVEAKAERNRVVELISRQYSDEGVFLVENILLRPRPDSPQSWPLLPAPCACGDACAPQEWDPYSFQVQLIFPGYTERFQEPGFRRFVEDVVRRELPAHLVPRVCFVGREQLADFEKKYNAWLESLASGAPKAAILRRLVECLNGLHTIYPAGILHGCKAEGLEAVPIVLNQSRIGSSPHQTESEPAGSNPDQP
ncbi:MAG: hypothetical protein WD490_07940 [Opitutales bacterium]